MICYEDIYWNIMKLTAFFHVFFNVSGMSVQPTYMWRWAETGEKWWDVIEPYSILQYHILFGYMVWFLTLSTWVQNDPHASSSFDVLFFLVYRHVYILCWTCLGILQFSYPFGRRLLQTQWQKRNQPMRQINLQRTVELACHDMLWGHILKHHETYCSFSCVFQCFRDVSTTNLHLETGKDGWKVMGRDWTLQYHILFGYMVWFLTLSTWVQNDPNASSSFDVLFFLVCRHVYILCWTCLGILQFSYPFGRRLLQTQWQKRNQPMRQINLQRTVELACHDMLWGYILKHHETYCNFHVFFNVSGMSVQHSTTNLHLETGRDGWKVMGRDWTLQYLTVSYFVWLYGLISYIVYMGSKWSKCFQ